jgi:O-methyltransferase
MEGIDGDFIETGIWRGGSCILMRGILDAYNDQTRKVWACDSFEGLPDPDIDKYPEDEGTPFHLWNFFLAVSQEEVEANFEKYGLLDDRVVFVKGYFEETLPNIKCQKISLMRLDGGFVIIDDYLSVDACRTAVHDYRKANGIRDEIIQIDWASVY